MQHHPHPHPNQQQQRQHLPHRPGLSFQDQFGIDGYGAVASPSNSYQSRVAPQSSLAYVHDETLQDHRISFTSTNILPLYQHQSQYQHHQYHKHPLQQQQEQQLPQQHDRTTLVPSIDATIPEHSISRPQTTVLASTETDNPMLGYFQGLPVYQYPNPYVPSYYFDPSFTVHPYYLDPNPIPSSVIQAPQTPAQHPLNINSPSSLPSGIQVIPEHPNTSATGVNLATLSLSDVTRQPLTTFRCETSTPSISNGIFYPILVSDASSAFIFLRSPLDSMVSLPAISTQDSANTSSAHLDGQLNHQHADERVPQAQHASSIVVTGATTTATLSSLTGYVFESSVHPPSSSSTGHGPTSFHSFSIPTVVDTSEQPSPTHFNHQVPHCRRSSALDSTNTVASVGTNEASSKFTAPSKYTPSVDGLPLIQEASSAILLLPNEVADSSSLDQLSSPTPSTQQLEPSPASTPKPEPLDFLNPLPISFAFHCSSSSAPETGTKKKKPPNSFMLYRKFKAKENRVMYKLNRYSAKQISVVIGELWGKEPEYVKRHYKAQADREKLRYDQEGSIPLYSYRPARTLSASRAVPSPWEPVPILSSSSSTESQAANATLSIDSTSSTSSRLPRLTMTMPLIISEWRHPQSLESDVSSPSSSAAAASPISATSPSLKFERRRFGRSGGGNTKSRTHVPGQKLAHRPKKPTTGVASGAANPEQTVPPQQQQQEHQTSTKAKAQGSEQEQGPISDLLRDQVASSTKERHHNQEQNSHGTVMTSLLLSRPPVQ
ncbi:hypothetical protein MVEG_06421 [Podila verticillata NRRL 6337]|nr:hypothetical protein MVEG_06421 [Podila verticillata NRRL 6337]